MEVLSELMVERFVFDETPRLLKFLHELPSNFLRGEAGRSYKKQDQIKQLNSFLRRKNKARVNLKTDVSTTIDSAIIISSVSKAVKKCTDDYRHAYAIFIPYL